jgi:hypothetical protein
MRRIHIYIIALLLFLTLVGYVFFIRDIERDIVIPHHDSGKPAGAFLVFPEP